MHLTGYFYPVETSLQPLARVGSVWSTLYNINQQDQRVKCARLRILRLSVSRGLWRLLVFLPRV